ncbi:MAG: hypothetical protein ACI88A_002377 [Paraglaciecola sp.]
MGTVLPYEALPEGFEDPLTGTEHDFLAALRSQQQHGNPAILVYRKTDLYAKTDNEIEVFFQRYFLDDQQRLQKAFYCFSSSGEFESMLEGHLHLWFDKNLPQVSDAELASASHWYSGNPFRGLKAFRFDQAQVYQGRGAAIAEGIEKLKAKAVLKQPFLLIMGMSGSGKSSLMRAGILPMLYNPQIVPKVSQFFRGVMRPHLCVSNKMVDN